jgi:hypothetical protein
VNPKQELSDKHLSFFVTREIHHTSTLFKNR